MGLKKFGLNWVHFKIFKKTLIEPVAIVAVCLLTKIKLHALVIKYQMVPVPIPEILTVGLHFHLS